MGYTDVDGQLVMRLIDERPFVILTLLKLFSSGFQPLCTPQLLLKIAASSTNDANRQKQDEPRVSPLLATTKIPCGTRATPNTSSGYLR